MVEQVTFNFDKYNVGGEGASSTDNKLTGAEVWKAAAEGWTVWDGFERGDRAMRTADAVDALFDQYRANNKPSNTDNRKDADPEFLSWANGNFNTKDVQEVIKNGDVTIVKTKCYTDHGIKTDTYIVKNNDDGTTEITFQGFDGHSARTLIDNRAGKLMVDFDKYDYYGYDRNGKFFNFKLGDFVKGLKNLPEKTNKLIEHLKSYVNVPDVHY